MKHRVCLLSTYSCMFVLLVGVVMMSVPLSAQTITVVSVGIGITIIGIVDLVTAMVLIAKGNLV